VPDAGALDPAGITEIISGGGGANDFLS